MKTKGDEMQTDKLAIKLMDFKDTCEFLKFKPSRLYSEVFKKRIPYIKIGASLRFKLSELEEWLDQNSTKQEGK